MRLPILLLTLAVMASATIYWKHPVQDAKQQAEYLLQLIIDAMYVQDIELFEKLVDPSQTTAQLVLSYYISHKAELVLSANKTADGGLIAIARSKRSLSPYFKWELNAESPSGYRLMICCYCSIIRC